ncbi:hypothetical protein MNBD_PLANCTO02-3436 [hydrothermal vent metagenome]|uniref:WXG100 family type VII secretion target n=1 Tax=hydrothermal vent metagenome TaxID=652676 RepID=A0A3B1D010_9ZZZZ
MAQAIVNPEDLRRFAQLLRKFNNGLLDQSASLKGQLDALATTWRDQENLKFSEEFEQHLKVISRFVEANEEHIPYLLRKAERIEEYLQQK